MLIRFKEKVVNLDKVSTIEIVEVTQGDKKPPIVNLVFIPTSFSIEYESHELAVETIDIIFDFYEKGSRTVDLSDS